MLAVISELEPAAGVDVFFYVSYEYLYHVYQSVPCSDLLHSV
jgi:hypothetical protein